MTDPILDAHQAEPRFFALSGPLAPISIRDQMIRGQWLIERLMEQGIITPAAETRPLNEFQAVIVGAGAAGVTAAITAANGRASALVVESAAGPFLRQAASGTRWLDPTQYDWPANWASGTYPTVGASPLTYPADRSARLGPAMELPMAVRITSRPLPFAGEVRNHHQQHSPHLFPIADSTLFRAGIEQWDDGFHTFSHLGRRVRFREM